MSIRVQIVMDRKGNPVATQMHVRQYKKMLELLEELEDVKAYKKAKKIKSDWIPFDKAFS